MSKVDLTVARLMLKDEYREKFAGKTSQCLWVEDAVLDSGFKTMTGETITDEEREAVYKEIAKRMMRAAVEVLSDEEFHKKLIEKRKEI